MRRGAGIPNSSLRLAKNQDDFDDPNGTEVDGIEFFPPGTNPPGFLLPDCPVPEEDEPVPSLHHAGSALAAAGAVADKRGGSGVTLAGRTGVASQVSAFSEWSSVAIQDEAPTATISGTTFVVEEGDVSVQGVTVDLFCNESPEPIASTTSNADGNFFFDGEVDGFEPGDDCYLEASKEVDGGALSGRNPSVSSEVFSFEVQEGENDRDIQLEPNADAEIIGNATWDNDGTQERSRSRTSRCSAKGSRASRSAPRSSPTRAASTSSTPSSTTSTSETSASSRPPAYPSRASAPTRGAIRRRARSRSRRERRSATSRRSTWDPDARRSPRRGRARRTGARLTGGPLAFSPESFARSRGTLRDRAARGRRRRTAPGRVMLTP